MAEPYPLLQCRKSRSTQRLEAWRSIARAERRKALACLGRHGGDGHSVGNVEMHYTTTTTRPAVSACATYWIGDALGLDGKHGISLGKGGGIYHTANPLISAPLAE